MPGLLLSLLLLFITVFVIFQFSPVSIFSLIIYVFIELFNLIAFSYRQTNKMSHSETLCYQLMTV